MIILMLELSDCGCRPTYTTQAGSTILFLNVVSLCEIHKLLDNTLMPDAFIIAYKGTFSKHIIFLPNICQNISLI